MSYPQLLVVATKPTRTTLEIRSQHRNRPWACGLQNRVSADYTPIPRTEHTNLTFRTFIV